MQDEDDTESGEEDDDLADGEEDMEDTKESKPPRQSARIQAQREQHEGSE